MAEDPLQIICAALGGIDTDQVAFHKDLQTGKTVAWVYLRPEQVATALREKGRFVRDAAVRTGIDIDVGLAKA